MELKQVIEKRASVRQFSQDTVKPEDLREMVRLAGLAPSVNNSQLWKFIVITNRELLKNMAADVHKRVEEMLPVDSEPEKIAKSQVEWFSTFFADAPATIAVLTRPYEAIVDQALVHSSLNHEDINNLRNHPDIQSLGASIYGLILAATDMGYGCCWLSGPLVAREALERQLGVESPWRLSAMVAVGKPIGNPRQRQKKAVEEIFEVRE